MKKWCWTVVCLIVLAACSPETIWVDVTRLVEVPAGTAAATPLPLEVTREIPIEVTRIEPEEVVVEVTRPPLGSAERPVQLVFPPLANTAVIASRGQELAAVLTRATATQFEISLVDDERTLIDLLCAAPQDTIGFLSAGAAVIAGQRCDAQAGITAVHDDGYTWQTGMLVVQAGAGMNTLADLAGKRWGVAEGDSLPDELYFRAMLADAGIEPGEIVTFPGESDAMLALLNGEVDFATAAFVPPILPYEERPWVYGEDDPELWRELGFSPSRSPIGYVIVWGETRFGGYRLRDARARIFDIEPEIYDATRILMLSAQIPNETAVFGAAFPLALSKQVTAVLRDYAADAEACARSLCAADFTGWIGLEPADESLFDAVLFTISTLDLTEDMVLN